MSQYMLVIR